MGKTVNKVSLSFTLLFILAVLSDLVWCYTIPEPFFKAYYPPFGLDMSIPDDGFTLVGFHGKINEKFEGFEYGLIYGDLSKAHNGRWKIKDRYVKLKIGDTIYYWLYVIRDGLGYTKFGEWTVTELHDDHERAQPAPELPATFLKERYKNTYIRHNMTYEYSHRRNNSVMATQNTYTSISNINTKSNSNAYIVFLVFVLTILFICP